jgi:hypothetical protein
LLDKKGDLLNSLDSIKKSYLNLIILKQLEKEACTISDYETLHELSEHERVIIEDINEIMKYIVPDLVRYRGDSVVRKWMLEIDRLKTSVIQKSLALRENLEHLMQLTRKNLDNLRVFTPISSNPIPCIVNLRA